MTKLQERLRENCVGQPATIEWPHRILHEAADALDAAELMLKSDEKLIEQLTLQRDGWKARSDAAEAEIARLKETNRLLGSELADCKAIEEANISAQPPAVGEDVVERAKKIANEPEPECCGNVVQDSHDEPPYCCGSPDPRPKTPDEVVEALATANLLRTKDAG